MSKKGTRTRVSKAQWLEAGLRALEHGGVEAVRVEALAKDLSISKSGFYWHFSNRAHLLTEIQNYWLIELTNVAAESPMIVNAPPRERLQVLDAKIREHNLSRYDLAFLAWAEHDAEVRKTVDEVLQIRSKTVRAAFSEMGYEGTDLEVRTKAYVAYQSIRSYLFPEQPKVDEEAQSEAFLNMIAGSNDQ